MNNRISIEKFVGADRMNDLLREAQENLLIHYWPALYGGPLQIHDTLYVKNQETEYSAILPVNFAALDDPNNWQDIIIGFRQNERDYLKALEEEE